MSGNGVDIFALVINYLDKSWSYYRIFWSSKTSGNAMALQLQGLLEKFGLILCGFAFVKDEGRNLGPMAIILWSIVDCEPLKMLWMCECTCFEHVMSKVCQCATNDDKVSTRLTLVNVKDA